MTVRAEPGPAPLLAVVPGPGGEIEACAVVAARRENGILVLGQRRTRGGNDGGEVSWAVLGSTPQGRQDAILMIGKRIINLARPWRLDITGLDEATAGLLASILPGAQVHPAPAVPYLQLEDGSLPPNVQSQRDRSARRIAADGLAEDVVFVSDPRDLLLLRDVIEDAHVARDKAAGHPCDLRNHPSVLAFWHTAWNAAAAAGQLEVGALLLDGELAAYCAAITEPPYLRVFDSRMITRWKTKYPGRRAEAETALRASRNSYRFIDWCLPGEDGLLAMTGKDPRLAVTASGL